MWIVVLSEPVKAHEEGWGCSSGIERLWVLLEKKETNKNLPPDSKEDEKKTGKYNLELDIHLKT